MIKFEQIANANKTIRTTDIKGKDYAEVNQRIKAFRMVHPNGTITTEILSLENGVVVMKTTILDDEGKVIGSGMAYEKESSSFINKTSYIENCETSAVGRALGMCGFGIDTSVASYEEVANAIENQPTKEEKKQEPAKSFRDLIQDYVAKQSKDEEDFKKRMTDIAKQYKLNGKSTEADFENVYRFVVEAA